MDLCDDIYVCVEEYNLLEALAASFVSTSHRQRRTQRLKISHVQNSENDVRVSSCFNLNIRSYISIRPPPDIHCSLLRDIIAVLLSLLITKSQQSILVLVHLGLSWNNCAKTMILISLGSAITNSFLF